MRNARGILAALVVVGLSACSREKGTDDFVIKGTTLDVHWAGATMEAPGAMWKWSPDKGSVSDSTPKSIGALRQIIAKAKEQKDVEVFRCVNRTDDTGRAALLFLVTRQPEKSLNAGTMDEIIEWTRKRLPDEGWAVARREAGPSDIPWPGSYRFRYELTSAGPTEYVHGYVAKKKRAYLVECVTLSPEEPAELVQFARSLSVR